MLPKQLYNQLKLVFK